MGDGNRSKHSNALSNYQNAVILREKLEAYALNPTHEATRPGGSHGKNKAVVFKSALGFDQSNCELLEERILTELQYHEAVLEEEGEWGKSYRADLTILGANGRTGDVRTIWLIRHGTDYPSLITLWVLPKGR